MTTRTANALTTKAPWIVPLLVAAMVAALGWGSYVQLALGEHDTRIAVQETAGDNREKRMDRIGGQLDQVNTKLDKVLLRLGKAIGNKP